MDIKPSPWSTTLGDNLFFNFTPPSQMSTDTSSHWNKTFLFVCSNSDARSCALQMWKRDYVIFAVVTYASELTSIENQLYIYIYRSYRNNKISLYEHFVLKFYQPLPCRAWILTNKMDQYNSYWWYGPLCHRFIRCRWQCDKMKSYEILHKNTF